MMNKGVYSLIFHFIWWKYIKPNLSTRWQTDLYEVAIAQAINNSRIPSQFWREKWSSEENLLEPVSKTIWKETSEEAAEGEKIEQEVKKKSSESSISRLQRAPDSGLSIYSSHMFYDWHFS